MDVTKLEKAISVLEQLNLTLISQMKVLTRHEQVFRDELLALDTQKLHLLQENKELREVYLSLMDMLDEMKQHE